jgi:Glycosyl transferase family 2
VSRRLRPRPLTRSPTVTVVVPCYNYGHYLPTAVASVLEQPGVSVEVIVIDDASSDDSAQVVRRLASTDDRVRPIFHGSNRGHIATYNEGLERARGDYVVLLSADDALASGALARATAVLESEPSVGFVYGFPVEFMDVLPPVPARVRNWTVWSGHEWIGRLCRTGKNCIFNPEVVMRTSVQHAIGGYDPELPHSGDLEMWLRAASVSDVARVNGAAQGYYRVHNRSMQRTSYAGMALDLEGRLAAFEKVLVGNGDRLRRRDELLTTTKRALAAFAVAHARSAYDRGHAEAEEIDACLAFAANTWPAICRTRRWRALVRRTERGPSPADRGVGPMARRALDDVMSRARWRRWRWTGIHV